MNVRVLESDHLKLYPVWTWSSEDESLLSPMAVTEPLPDDVGSLFIAARLYLANGMELPGYIIVDLGAVFAIGIFAGERELIFNRNVASMADQELRELFTILGKEPFPVFPLTYQTQFHFAGEPNLAGTFDLGRVDPRG
jgi:hypothetical protein